MRNYLKNMESKIDEKYSFEVKNRPRAKYFFKLKCFYVSKYVGTLSNAYVPT